MFKSLKLNNFRKHTNTTLTLGEGLSVLRGSNEQGKSTVFEAIAYAIFGTKALRDPLENVVTWGNPMSTLKVELDFSVDDVDYNIKRGKSGAELTYKGEVVTGQVEVSNFVSTLLRVDVGTAVRLILSPQSGIRGALESGARATTELIENLAEFYKIDHLIELMQEKLSIGSSVSIEANIKTFEETLARLKDQVVPVDVKAHEVAIETAQNKVSELTKNLATAEVAVEIAQERVSTAKQQSQDRARLEQSAKAAYLNIVKLKEKLDQARAQPEVKDAELKLDELRQQVRELEQMDDIKAAYSAVKPYLTRVSEPSYKGAYADLLNDIQETVLKSRVEENKVDKQEGRLKLLKQKLTQGTCTFCGKDFSGVPEVEAVNAPIREEISKLSTEIVASKGELKQTLSKLSELVKTKEASTNVINALKYSCDYVELADDMLPPMLQWIGPNPVQGSRSIAGLILEIQAIEGLVEAYNQAMESIPVLESKLTDANEMVTNLERQIADIPNVNVGDAQLELKESRENFRTIFDELSDAKQNLYESRKALQDALTNYTKTLQAVENTEGALRKAHKDLSDLTFNNNLLKRVRQCRPAISDKLWSIVLVATSNYFSEMRGVKSEVTKAPSGFLVDGHPITSLSGSTLDILGLAVRVALVRTFLPNSTFILLDEPCAAADAERTAATVGFLSTCGFKQIILITHEEVSQDVADRVILLGD